LATDVLVYKPYLCPDGLDATCFGFYNNFFITKIEFWVQPRVWKLLRYFDAGGGFFTHRWNDILVHTAVASAFLEEHQLYHFKDFDYQHATVKGNQLYWGGLIGKIPPGDDDLWLTERSRIWNVQKSNRCVLVPASAFIYPINDC
jgi:hypothetical protein